MIKMDVKEGDTVLFSVYDATEFSIRGRQLYVFSHSVVYAVIV